MPYTQIAHSLSEWAIFFLQAWVLLSPKQEKSLFFDFSAFFSERERFLIRLSTDFCERILRMSVGSLWRNEYSFYLVDFQYSLIQISMLEFLESLEFIEF